MKLDKDFLIKQKFWVVLGGGLFLTLLAIFFLLVIAPGAIGKKRKQVEDEWGKVKNTKDVKNPEVIQQVAHTAEVEKAFESVAFKKASGTQTKLVFWPREFDGRFEPETGLFALEVAVLANANLAEAPADEPKQDKEDKGEPKKDKNGKKDNPEEQSAMGKYHGKIVDFNGVDEFIVVEGRDKKTRKFQKIPQTKVTFAEERKEGGTPQFANLADKKGAVVAVSYFRIRRFYDPLTEQEQKIYTESYKSQLRPLLLEAGPVNELPESFPLHERVVVQFPGYVYSKDLLPTPEAPYFRHVKDWVTQNKDISEEAWLAQEDLWILREVFRIVKTANDSVADFKQVSPGRFVNPYWQIDVLGVQGDTVKIKLTNRLDRPQPVNVHFRIQFEKGGPFVAIAPVKDTDPLLPAGTRVKDVPKDSVVRDLKIESDEPGKQVVGVRQVLTWETAAVRRIDFVSIGNQTSLSQRNSFRTLKPFKKKPAPEKTAEDTKDPMAPGGGKMKGFPPGFGGGPGAAEAAGQTAHGLVEERYFDVTPQARRVPVGVVLIVDQAQVARVETAFADSPMRFLINQVLIHRYPKSVRPDASGDTVVASSGGVAGPSGSYPPSSLMPSSGGMSGGRGYGTAGPRYSGAPGMGRPMGMSSAPLQSMRPGMAGAGFPSSGRAYPGSAGMMYPGGGMPGYGSSLSSAGGSEEQEANVELVIYGVVSLYEPSPPRPPLPEATTESTPPPATK